MWVLLAAPTLCVGGVLAHICKCAVAACLSDDSCPTDPCDDVDAPGHLTQAVAEACGHEDSCATDPCPDVLQMAEPQSARLGADVPMVVQLPSQFLLEHMLPRAVLDPSDQAAPWVESLPQGRLRPLLI